MSAPQHLLKLPGILNTIEKGSSRENEKVPRLTELHSHAHFLKPSRECNVYKSRGLYKVKMTAVKALNDKDVSPERTLTHTHSDFIPAMVFFLSFVPLFRIILQFFPPKQRTRPAGCFTQHEWVA